MNPSKLITNNNNNQNPQEDQREENCLGMLPERENLSRGFWAAKQPRNNYLPSNKELETERIAHKLRNFKSNSPEEEREERALGVSTKLKLFEDPWKIKKTLTVSDVNNHLCRLLLHGETVEKHIMALWARERVEHVDRDGERVVVWDYDTGSAHELVFKRWRSSMSFVFIDNWVNQFVRRRELMNGDEIGLFWDTANSRFGFRVLARVTF